MERDDVIEYSLETHHSEEHGKQIRKKIYFVTILLSVITALEVGVGIKWPMLTVSAGAWTAIKWGYIVLTLVKAGYIVLIFMHLGDEKLEMRRLILFPYLIFAIYLIYILLFEGTQVNAMWMQ
jgi:cytochrome c oxidase subunit IV